MKDCLQELVKPCCPFWLALFFHVVATCFHYCQFFHTQGPSPQSKALRGVGKTSPWPQTACYVEITCLDFNGPPILSCFGKSWKLDILRVGSQPEAFQLSLEKQATTSMDADRHNIPHTANNYRQQGHAYNCWICHRLVKKLIEQGVEHWKRKNKKQNWDRLT